MRRAIFDPAMRPVMIVQPTYETPIKPLLEKSCTAGIRGMGNGC